MTMKLTITANDCQHEPDDEISVALMRDANQTNKYIISFDKPGDEGVEGFYFELDLDLLNSGIEFLKKQSS